MWNGRKHQYPLDCGIYSPGNLALHIQPGRRLIRVRPQAQRTYPLRRIRSKYEEARAVITDGKSDQDAQNKALDKLDAYWHTLPGKSARYWQGWVVDMEPDIASLVPTPATRVPADNTQSRTIIVSMEDPYSNPPAVETPAPSRMFRSSLKPPYAYLNRTVSPKEERLCVGDKISFSGDIGDIPGEYGELGVIIPSAQVEMVEERSLKQMWPPISKT